MDSDIEGYPVDLRNPCTRIDHCKYSTITGETVVECVSVPLPAGTSCSDGNACDGDEVCNGQGRCMAGTPPVVDDADPCSLDWCDPATGVHHAAQPEGTLCSDANACTKGDVCDSSGKCVGAALANGAGCADGNLCNGDETCAQGVCQPGTPVVIDDGDATTIDACDPVTGLVSHADCLKQLDLTVATNLAQAAKCLYTDEQPLQRNIQTHIDKQPFVEPFDPFGPDAPFDPIQVAMLHGEIRDTHGTPLSGVTISVLEQSWAGSTVTRADGVFDMAVHGGGPLTVSYSKTGYLPVHRQSAPSWQDYAVLQPVVMIPQSDHAMPIAVGHPDVQVARGSVLVDDDGIRQATVLFPADTKAKMILPGEAVPKDLQGTVHVRITEYTVGENGPAAMPASLPPTSGYTYAADLSIDEAQAAGATKVEFEEPVIVYLENFIGFHVGEDVPSGCYDAQKAQWIPSENGRVIRIDSIANGEAVVDTTGSVPGALPLQVDSAELKKLASLYQPGQTLWRIPIKHFSNWDWNWGFGPPDGATYPNEPEPSAGASVNEPCTQSGSVIDCENQALGEAFAIAGTPYSLHYQSDRQPGRLSSLDVPIHGVQHEDLLSIQLNVQIASLRSSQSFVNPPGIKHMAWNNRDEFGRLLQGTQPLKVSVGYMYRCEYQRGSFGASGGEDAWVDGDRAACRITLWKDWKGTIGHLHAIHLGLGGMTLSDHHFYDPMGKTLYLGDGRTQRGEALSPVIHAVAGSGGWNGYCPAGNGALGTEISPVKVAVAPDGGVYIADAGCDRIRLLDPAGDLVTVVPKSVPGIPQDLHAPADLAMAPDGGLYFTDDGNHRILKRNPDGTVRVIAGSGSPCFYPASADHCGDGGPAVNAQFNFPTGLAVGPDGSIYVADQSNGRIRRRDGIFPPWMR
jgi:hypothetical protein